jgi:hypothetical protein
MSDVAASYGKRRRNKRRPEALKREIIAATSKPDACVGRGPHHPILAIALIVVRYADEHFRYKESLGNLTPAEVCFGRGQTILRERERIKRQTIAQRRLQRQKQAA